MSDKPPTSTVIWRPIQTRCDYRPDAESEILIYDGVLDDVVKGYVDVDSDGETLIWIDQTTGDPLPDPQFWADVPFPGE
ncbi:MAG: hypothetical protein VR65_24940 [Desulfobulbaceae bacterium BRH_c16a]|nr:MAG: hypothetical protein VR65_24940 [Desulfobulbaceae bacterium BRH_c16a]